MPESKKRKVVKEEETKQVHYNMAETKGGKVLVFILAASMVVGLLFAAVYLMIQAL